MITVMKLPRNLTAKLANNRFQLVLFATGLYTSLFGILAPGYAKLMVSLWLSVKFQSYLVRWLTVLS